MAPLALCTEVVAALSASALLSEVANSSMKTAAIPLRSGDLERGFAEWKRQQICSGGGDLSMCMSVCVQVSAVQCEDV